VEIESFQDLQSAQQLIAIRQYEVAKERNLSVSEARKIAAAEIGATYRPALTATEFESMLGRARSKFYEKERIAGIKRAWAEKSSKKPGRKPATSSGEPLTNLYRAWCEQNEHVAGDVELSHFARCTPAAISYARNELVRNGYKFTKNGTGFFVEVEKPKYTERQWQERERRIAEIEKLFGELKK